MTMSIEKSSCKFLVLKYYPQEPYQVGGRSYSLLRDRPQSRLKNLHCAHAQRRSFPMKTAPSSPRQENCSGGGFWARVALYTE